MNRIARASLIIAFFFGIDKILGLLRQVLFNRTFVAAERDIFFVSNNIPDLLSALISGGALGIALIPVLTEYLDEEGRSAAWDLFSRILNLAFIVTASLALIIIVFARPLVQYVIAPGFADPARWDLTARLMRLDLAAILIFSISGMVMAGLQANQHFLSPAMAPVMYNLGQIAGILLLAPRFGILGLVYGVILGAVLHLGIQVPALLHFGFRWAPHINLRHPGVRKVLWLMGPRILSIFFLQVYFLARDRFASYFTAGGVSALNNGWFIMQLPETLIGTAIAIALLPSLSEFINRGEKERFRQTANGALRVMLALGLPAAVLLAVGLRPLVEKIFRFGPEELNMVVWATRAFLLGLVTHTWLEVAVRSWYANQEARLPLLGAFLQIILYLLMAPLFGNVFGPAGLALADTLAFTSQALLLLILLNRRYPGLLRVGGTLLRVALASIGGALLAILLMQLPLPPFPLSLAAMALGGLFILPFLWPEIKILVHLGGE
jgi:putative peptidoglycan lipid II flippase